MNFLRSISDAIIDRSPEELIGAMLVTLAVAIVVACVYSLGQRKSSPTPTFVGGLALAAGAVCMALAAGYVKYAETQGISRSRGNALRAVGPPRRGPGPPRPWAHRSSGFQVVMAADENHDGHLTSEEVARLVRKADTDGDGSVDVRDLDRLIMGRFKRPVRSSAHVTVGPRAPGRGVNPPDTAPATGVLDDEEASTDE